MLNQIVLVGRLVQDPEIKKLHSYQVEREPKRNKTSSLSMVIIWKN